MRSNLFLLILVYSAALFAHGQNSLSTGVAAPRPAEIRSDVVVPGTTLIEGNVVKVHDGDTISIATRDGKIYAIRLEGLDAPEVGQDYFLPAKQHLGNLVEGLPASALLQDNVDGPPYLARLYVGGNDVNRLQLEAGMAWYSPETVAKRPENVGTAFLDVQRLSRLRKVGIWSLIDPMPPWTFRRLQENVGLSETARSPEPAAVVAEKPESVKMARTSNESGIGPAEGPTGAPAESGAREYKLGPRGGCYYITESGRRKYVKDKSLCLRTEVIRTP